VGSQQHDIDAETTPLQNPEDYQYDIDVAEVAEVWRRGSVVASWLLDLTAISLAEDKELSDFSGRVSDSGEGRWTSMAAIKTGAPALVLTAALFNRFTSRGEADFADKLATELGKAGLTEEADGQWRRIIIEKPFGRDLESARELNKTLHQSFEEHQIYRIDHVQITVAESLGVEDRASYYEEAGALRDMIANHLLAVLSVIAMEPPNSVDADTIRDEQTKVLKAIELFDPKQVLTDTVRGQYGEGVPGNGEHLHAYRDEPGIADDSATETFVALRLKIDSWRWAGVPFYLRTGKRMAGRYSEVVIQYKHAPNMMFRGALERHKNIAPDRLVLRIQPNEGISMEFNAKVPGTEFKVSQVLMDFDYDDYFEESTTSSGYATLIYDCLCGDAMLFKRADNIEVCWELLQPILDVWQSLPPRSFPNYPACSWGPEEADELLTRDGFAWKNTQ
jgi:glucose-6-phosphate 1-dehydrogenase